MKKISTLVTSLFVGIAVFAAPGAAIPKAKPAPSVSAFAARPKSTLTIQSSDNADIKVVLDGRRFEPNDNSLRIDNVENGSHTIKIYKEKRNGLFSIVGKRYDVVFNSTITVQPRTNMSITIDRNNRIAMGNTRVRGNDGGWANNDRDFDYNHGGGYGDYSQNGQQGGQQNGQWDNHYGYTAGMSDRDFSAVLQSMNKEWLESNKLKSASHIVTSNQLSSAQVKQLVQMFSFESNKLQLAKDAYANTVDKKNYYMINDVFSFNSSKDELARFIRNFH